MNKIGLLAIAGAAVTGITATALTRRGSSSAEGDGSSIKAPLIPNSNFATAYKNKYGGSYGKYLAGPDTSEVWWNNKYQEIKSSISQSKGFERVTKGFGGDDSSLNKVCEKAYGYREPQEDEDQQPIFDKESIWRLCSDVKTRPKSISEYNFEPSEKSGEEKEEYKAESGVQLTVGESHPSSTQLASIKHPGNKWFWELKGEEFFKDQAIIAGTGFFSRHYQTHKSESDKANVIKDACEKTYRQIEGHSEDGYADSDEIFKWCSFSGEYQSPSA